MDHEQQQLSYTLNIKSIWLRCRKNLHLQNIEPLAKAVVQRIKLCGQILSHLHRKKEEKEPEMVTMLM